MSKLDSKLDRFYNHPNIMEEMNNSIRSAAVNPENLDIDGKINWSFVDADAYHQCFKYYSSTEGFYKDFDKIALTIRSESTEGCADCEYMKAETDGDITMCDECAEEKREAAMSSFRPQI